MTAYAVGGMGIGAGAFAATVVLRSSFLASMLFRRPAVSTSLLMRSRHDSLWAVVMSGIGSCVAVTSISLELDVEGRLDEVRREDGGRRWTLCAAFASEEDTRRNSQKLRGFRRRARDETASWDDLCRVTALASTDLCP